MDFSHSAYETTSNTLGFTAYCMALNTDKQDKLCQEIDNYYSEHPVCPSHFNAKSLISVSYQLDTVFMCFRLCAH